MDDINHMLDMLDQLDLWGLLGVLDLLNQAEREEKEEIMKHTLFLLQNVMRNLGLSLEQAMTATGIPESERAFYVEQLGNR